MERAGRVVAALGEERAEGCLEAGGLLDVLLQVTDRGVDRTVEHGGAHRVGEEGGPGGTQLAAVAEAEVGDALLAQCLADRVHVMGRALRAHEGKHATVLAQTALTEVGAGVDERLSFGVAVG